MQIPAKRYQFISSLPHLEASIARASMASSNECTVSRESWPCFIVVRDSGNHRTKIMRVLADHPELLGVLSLLL